MKDLSEINIVFYDGVCGLCDHTVQFLLRIDRHHKLKFSPLQGGAAQQLLAVTEREGLKTLIYHSHAQLYYRSRAILEILIEVGGPWTLFKILRIVPPFLLDFFYSMVARHRYAIFGKFEKCRLPSAPESSKFIP